MITKSTGYAKYNGSAWSFVDETYSLSNHTHDYLPLSGGNLTGNLTINSNTVWHAGNLSIGAENLFNNGGKANTYSSSWQYIYGLKDDEQITVQVWCDAGATATISCLKDNGYGPGGSISTTTGYGKLTYSVKPYTNNANNNGTVLLIITASNAKIKVERGNQPTDMSYSWNDYLASNVASATKLQNTRTIWGQNFNGEGNVSGALSGATTGTFSSYLTANRFYTGYDSGLANAISCSNWFRSNGATGWLNATYTAGILSDAANIVRTYSTNKFKVYNTAIDSILTLGGVTAANIVSSGAVVAGALNGTLPDDLPIATTSLFGVIKTGLSLKNNAGVVNLNGRHYTTVSTYTDAAVREVTAEIALGTGSMANGTLDQIHLSFAPLTTTRGLTANVIATSTGVGMGLKLSFRKDTGTGRWYIMIYNDSGAAITRDGILLSIRGQQII